MRILAFPRLALTAGLLGFLFLFPGGTTGVPALPGALTPIDLVVETLRVGPGGTETIGTDQASIVPGRGALLEKEVGLPGRTAKGKRVVEKMQFRAEIRVDSSTPSRLALSLRSRVNVVAATGGISIPRSPVVRNARVDLAVGASHLFEIYESAATGAKITLNVRWSPAEDPQPGAGTGIPIPLAVRLYEVGGENPVLVNEGRLLAAVGGSASATFNRNVALPSGEGEGRRFRQEQVEVTLSPRFRIGRDLSLAVQVGGDVATRTAETDVTHPVAHQGTYLLSSGVPGTVELEVVAADPEVEGWTRVRYRLEFRALF